MNKVIVTGLGVGYDFGICESCQLDFSWIIDKPSTLIWADKLLITKEAWDARTEGIKQDKLNKAVNLVIDIAMDNNLIEIINPKDIFSQEISDLLYSNVEKDSKLMIDKFRNVIKKGSEGVPNAIIIDGEEYCGPYMASIYASIKLAEELNANCLFNDRDYSFLKYKYGIHNEVISRGNKINIMREIFSLYLPNELAMHNYAFTSDEKCGTCVNDDKCKDSYLSDIENRTKKIIQWRNYDEIMRGKEELEKIIESKDNLGNNKSFDEIRKEFSDKQNKINRNIKKVFPAIRRWTNLTTVIATPISIYSAATGNMQSTFVSTSMLAISKAIDEYAKYYESKNNWVGFINKLN